MASNGYAGVSLWADAAQTQYRSLKDYLGDIAAIWDEIDAKSQTQLLDTLFGKRGAGVGTAILGNFEQVENAIEEMENAAGAADEEMSIVEDSIEFKLNNLKQTWVGVLQQLIDNGMLGDAIDALTRISEVLGEIITTIGPLPTLFAGLGIRTILPNLDKLWEGIQKFNLSDIIGNVKEVSDVVIELANFLSGVTEDTEDSLLGPLEEGIEVVDGVIESVESVGETLESGAEFIDDISNTLSDGEMAFLDFGSASDVVSAALSEEELAFIGIGTASDVAVGELVAADAAMATTGATATATTGAVGSLGAALLTIAPYAAALAAVGVALYAAYKAWDYYYISVKEATSALNDFQSEYSETESVLKKQQRAIDELSDSYFDLAKGVDKITGKNISLSSEGYEEFVSTNQQLAEMFPQLISGVDAYGNYILDLGDDADVAREKLEALIKQQREAYNYDLYTDLPEVLKNSKVLIEDAVSAVNLYEELIPLQLNDLEFVKELGSLTEPLKDNLTFTFDDVARAHEFMRVYNAMIEEVRGVDPESAKRLLFAEDFSNINAPSIIADDLTEEDKKRISAYFTKYINEVSAQSDRVIKDYNQKISSAKVQMDSAWNSLRKNIVGGIDFLTDDDSTIEALTNFVNSLPAEFAESLTDVDIQQTISEWVTEFETLDNVTKLKFNNLFDPNLTPEERIQLYNELKSNLPEDLKVPIRFVVEKDQDLIDRVKASKSRLSKRQDQFGVMTVSPQIKSDIDTFFDEMQIDTEEEYNLWLEVTTGIDDATEAMKAYRNAVAGAKKTSEGMFDLASFKEQDSDLEKLQSLYKSFRDNIEGDSITVPLELSDVDELRERWESIVGKEEFDKFEVTVTTDSSSIAQVQAAFDGMATTYARNMIKIQGATKETMDMVKSQMKMDGLEAEGVEKFVDSVVAEDKMQAFVDTLDDAQDAEGKMADGAVDAAADIYKEAQALGITDDVLKDYLVKAALAGNIVLSGDTTWLDILAEKLGIDIELLKELLNLSHQGSGYVTDSSGGVHSIYGGSEANNYLKKQEEEKKKRENDNKYRNLNLYPDPKDASKAGGESGDAWVEAYEKELAELDDLKAQGLISEREYLDRLKALIDKYFAGRAAYAKKYAQEMQKYMDQMLTHYNSVISSIISLLDKRIDNVNEQRDSIISTLEEEKEAAEEAIQAQIDAIQSEIDALDDLIDKKNEEIDALNEQINAINKANDARDRAITLQKAEYDLQRMMNQRSKLVYTGEIGTMRYEQDQAGIRDAREAVKDAEDDIAIAKIEDQIDAIEKEIKAIEKQKEELKDEQELLQKQLEETSKYYEKLIKEQEKYFDELLKGMEKQKSKWEELAEVDEIAKSWSLVSEEMERLGFTIDDVLSGNDAAFEAFKGQYIQLLADMHSGDEHYLAGLKETVGQLPEKFGEVYDAASKTKEPLANIATTADDASGKVGSLGSNASTAAGGVNELKTASEGIADNLEKLQTVDLTEFTGKLSGVSEDIQGIIDKIGMPGAAGTLVGAFESLNNLKFEAFTKALGTLQNTIGSVVGLLTGEGGAPTGDLTGESMEGGTNTGGGGLKKALEDVQATAMSTIGGGGKSAEQAGNDKEDSAEGDGTVVGSFNALKDAIGLATTAIGNKDSKEDTADLIGSLETLGTKNTTVLGNETEGVIGDWHKFNIELEDAKKYITDMAEGLNNLEDSYETELTVKLNIIGEEYTGTAIRGNKRGHWSVNIPSAIGLPGISGEAISHLKHNALGTAKFPANFAGNWGYEGGKTLIAELGPELVVFPDGHAQTFDRPQIVDLPKNSVIFNHLQTGQILDDKNQIKAHASGTTLPSGYSSISMSGSYNDLLNKVKAIDMPTMSGIKSTLDNLAKNVQSEIRNVATTKTNVTQNNTFNISGVTGEEVAQKINSTLTQTFQGMALNAYQRSMA